MSYRSIPVHLLSLRIAPVLAAALLFASACGHKAPPFPPPLRHPATTQDLFVVQRGEEILLSFGYPQSTVSGTPLEPLHLVEYWELERAVPAWVAPDTETATDATTEGQAAAAALVAPSDEEATPEEPEASFFEGLPGSGSDPSREDTSDETAAVEPEEAETAYETPEEAAGTATDSDTEPSLPPEPPTSEELLTVDGREFSATAVLKTTLDEPALTAATYGDQIVLTLPLNSEPAQGDAKKSGTSEPADTADGSEPGTEDTPEVAMEYGMLYGIKTGISQKLISSLSNVVVIARRTAPEAPEAFSLEPGPSGISLRWPGTDAEILGFHVYRRDAQSPHYGQPLAFVPVEDPFASALGGAAPGTAPGAPLVPLPGASLNPDVEIIEEGGASGNLGEREYFDRTALFGQRYIYALTAVSHQSPVVESAITIEREVDYADRFAPTIPQDLIALAESGRIRLLWNASPQIDVAGYVVSRSERGGDFKPLHEELISELEYNDRTVRSGQDYTYRVVARDEAGNESDPSQTVDVRAP